MAIELLASPDRLGVTGSLIPVAVQGQVLTKALADRGDGESLFGVAGLRFSATSVSFVPGLLAGASGDSSLMS